MIKLRGLERRYPLGKEKFFYVLRDINLHIAEGEFVSVMGPSGAGKSTLLHILGMHDHGWEGEYSLNDTAVHHLKFFFSSRRRHTRLTCDWSSDVCSSDLKP